jgi:hypothetical protein
MVTEGRARSTQADGLASRPKKRYWLATATGV